MIPDDVKQDPVAAALLEHFPDVVTAGKLAFDELTLHIDAAQIIPVCQYLKDDGWIRLSSITALDWHPREPRFEVVYHLQRIDNFARLRLKCLVGGENPEHDSVWQVWHGADWYEREIFDLFGILFRGHPNLKRIMMPDNWNGHPLRKDYPIHGYKYSYKDKQ